ncbi:MAG: nitrilase-related carbon-nitrogen hydrolase [Atopobiaceae bacterium]
MKIAIAQMSSVAGDFEVTAKRMAESAKKAAAEGARLVVFPYAVLTGPSPVEESDTEAYVGDAAETLRRLGDEIDCAAIVPVVAGSGTGLAAEAFLIDEGQLVPLRMGAMAASMGALAQSGQVPQSGSMPAPDLPEFELDGLRFGVAFTYDDLDDYRDYDFALDVLLYLPQDGYIVRDSDAALSLALDENRFAKDAAEISCWLACADSVGGYGTALFAGGSFVLDPEGHLQTKAPLLEESLLVFDTDDAGEGTSVSELPHAGEETKSHVLWELLVRGLADLVHAEGEDKVALALDGSLASGLLAALACDALGPRKVEALLVDEGTSSQELAQRLHIETKTPDFRLPVPQPGAWAEESPELLRGVEAAFLSELARQEHALVLLPDDKTGLSLGEGRTAIAGRVWAPFGDIWRSTLVSLAEERMRVSPVLPDEMLGRYAAPDIFGISQCAATERGRLEALDRLLATRIEDVQDMAQLLDDGYPADFVKATIHRLHDAALTRQMVPPCFVVSNCTLTELETPVGVAWCDHEREDSDAQNLDDIVNELERMIRGQKQGTAPSQDAEALADAFELIRELSGTQEPKQQEGMAEGDGQDGFTIRPGFPSWGQPFSEN